MGSSPLTVWFMSPIEVMLAGVRHGITDMPGTRLRHSQLHVVSMADHDVMDRFPFFPQIFHTENNYNFT